MAKNESPLIATDCPGCLFQLRAGLKKKGVDILHTAELFSRVVEYDQK